MVVSILDNPEKVIDLIVNHTGSPKEQILERIRSKQAEYGGLLTEAGAAYAIAKELNVEIPDERKAMHVAELKQGLNNVSLDVTLKQSFPIREFDKNGRKGHVLNAIVADDSGDARLVVWNEAAERVAAFAPGTKLSINGIYTKEGMNGLEAHVGAMGTIKAESIVAATPVEQKIVTFGDIKAGDPDISLYARIKSLYNTRSFESAGRAGKVRNAVITDGKSELRLVLWGQHADRPLVINQSIIVEHAYSKESENPVTGERRLELHVGGRGSIKAAASAIPSLGKRVSIASLKDGDQNVEVRAVIVQMFPPTPIKVCAKCGVMNLNCSCNGGEKQTMITNAVIDDGTANMRAVFYRDVAEAFLGITGQDLARDQNSPAAAMANMLGSEKLFFGSVKRSDFSGEPELVVRGFDELDIDREIGEMK